VKAQKIDFQDIIVKLLAICCTNCREIKSGVSALSQYLNKKTNFGYNKAVTASAKIAYLTACMMRKIEPKKIDWNSLNPESFKNKKIEHEKFSVLNKALKAGYPEAWFYWLNLVEILDQKSKA